MIFVMYHAKHNKLGLYRYGCMVGHHGYWYFETIEGALDDGWQVIGEL